MLRVGVLGAGFMGGTHARALHGLPEVEVAGIYARSERRAGPLANELGTSWTDDIKRILHDPKIDAVSICLPTTEHRRALTAALAAGKHVLLEKPLALTIADADAIVDLACQSDNVVMIGHVLRFWPEYVELHRIVASGELGRPVSALAIRRQPFPAWSELFGKSELTGGAVIDMMIHDYDALNWILGTPTSVVARGVVSERSGGWDQTQVMIAYEGSSAQVDGGMMMPDSYPFSSSLQVLCERGAIEYEFQAGGRSVEMGGGVNELMIYPAEGEPERRSVQQQDPYVAEIAYFTGCIAANTAPERATPEDARLALRVARAARASLDHEEMTPVLVDSSGSSNAP